MKCSIILTRSIFQFRLDSIAKMFLTAGISMLTKLPKTLDVYVQLTMIKPNLFPTATGTFPIVLQLNPTGSLILLNRLNQVNLLSLMKQLNQHRVVNCIQTTTRILMKGRLYPLENTIPKEYCNYTFLDKIGRFINIIVYLKNRIV